MFMAKLVAIWRALCLIAPVCYATSSSTRPKDPGDKVPVTLRQALPPGEAPIFVEQSLRPKSNHTFCHVYPEGGTLCIRS